MHKKTFLIIGLFLLLSLVVFTAEEPEKIGIISLVEGKAYFSGANGFEEIEVGMDVYRHDTITVQKNARIEIQMETAVIWADQNTMISVSDQSLTIALGRICVETEEKIKIQGPDKRVSDTAKGFSQAAIVDGELVFRHQNDEFIDWCYEQKNRPEPEEQQRQQQQIAQQQYIPLGHGYFSNPWAWYNRSFGYYGYSGYGYGYGSPFGCIIPGMPFSFSSALRFAAIRILDVIRFKLQFMLLSSMYNPYFSGCYNPYYSALRAYTWSWNDRSNSQMFGADRITASSLRAPTTQRTQFNSFNASGFQNTARTTSVPRQTQPGISSRINRFSTPSFTSKSSVKNYPSRRLGRTQRNYNAQAIRKAQVLARTSRLRSSAYKNPYQSLNRNRGQRPGGVSRTLSSVLKSFVGSRHSPKISNGRVSSLSSVGSRKKRK